LWSPVTAEEAPPTTNIGDRPREVRAPAGKVLLVDDEELVRSSTAGMLVALGFEVLEATSAEEAIDAIERGAAFDILITDDLMRGQTGLALAEHVREFHPETPVLILSGYADVASFGERYPLLPKPFRQDELSDALQGFLRAPH
jgi:CheY-like chemotaxis protein